MVNDSKHTKIIMNKKTIVLREERKSGDYRFLGAEVKDNGDLVFEGKDLGSGVKAVFDCVEYEWYWTIKAANIPKFKDAIGENGDILELLEKNFSHEKAAGLSDFMNKNDIPFEFWSRIGD